MQLWTPPTPPQDDNDIYIDSVMCLMYETTPIPEAKLPPVYVRKERKRHKTDPSGMYLSLCWNRRSDPAIVFCTMFPAPPISGEEPWWLQLLVLQTTRSLSAIAYTCIPSMWDAEAEGS